MKYIIKKIEFGWVCKDCNDVGFEHDYPFYEDLEYCGLCKGIFLKSKEHFFSNEHHEKYIIETCDYCTECFEIRWHSSKGVEYSDKENT